MTIDAGTARITGKLGRVPDAVAARDRARHRQRDLPVDPGRSPAAGAPAERAHRRTAAGDADAPGAAGLGGVADAADHAAVQPAAALVFRTRSDPRRRWAVPAGQERD